MDVAEWLTGLGLGQYATPFDAENVDLSVVPTLSDQDLKDLGVEPPRVCRRPICLSHAAMA